MKTNITLSIPRPSLFWIAGLVIAWLTSASAIAQTTSPSWTNLWKLPAHQEYDFLLTNAAGAALNNVRGACLNPANGNVIYATRDGGSNHLTVVDGATGVVLTRLSGAGVTGGGLALSQVRAAGDGVIYAANVAAPTATGASQLKIYRWESDATTTDPLLVFTYLVPSLNTGGTRFGDVMDLRGSGVTTEIIMSGIGGSRLAVFTTTDGTNFNANLNELSVLTNYLSEIPLPAGLAAGDVGRALCFDGTNNAVFGKTSASATRYVTYNPVALTATNGGSFVSEARLVGFDLTTTNGLKVLTGVAYGSSAAANASEHQARLFDITATNAPQISASEPMPLPYIANGNAIGAADVWGDKIMVLEPGGGLALFRLFVVTNPPPSITIQPIGNTNILTGGYFNLAVSAAGSGLKYQWRLNDAPIVNATNALLPLTNLTASAVGNYVVVVTNAGGAITSSVAEIGLLPSTLTSVSAKLWQLPAGSRSYLDGGSFQRSMAFHALSNQVLIVNRATTNIHVLDASTGNNLTNLNMSGVVEQFGQQPQFVINTVGVADDGAIYAANLSGTISGDGYTIYRWADADPNTIPTIAYGPGNPAFQRIGDTFAVSGSGVDTKLIASTRSGTVVIVFTTFDGINFNPNTVDVATAPTPAPAGFAGLGLAAGEGDSFWATSGSFLLRKVVYDLVNNTNDVPIAIGGQTGNNIGVDSVNNFVASIGTTDTPSNLRLLDIIDPAAPAILIDQEFFGSDNDNVNGTGTVAFDVLGGRVFALDSNNGLLALKYAPRLYSTPLGTGSVVTWTGPGALQASAAATGTYTNVTGAASPYTNTAASSLFFRVMR